MTEPLQIYLHDHYSGSTFAAELLETLQKEYSKQELGSFAGEILAEVNHDRDILKSLIQQIGSAGPDLKDAGAWFMEKVSRLKLSENHPEGIGVFEALEMLSLGILGKRSLWVTLRTIADLDSRMAGFDFSDLSQKAENQFERVEQFRLRTARLTFDRSLMAQ